jgi:hypothetical protein
MKLYNTYISDGAIIAVMTFEHLPYEKRIIENMVHDELFFTLSAECIIDKLMFQGVTEEDAARVEHLRVAHCKTDYHDGEVRFFIPLEMAVLIEAQNHFEDIIDLWPSYVKRQSNIDSAVAVDSIHAQEILDLINKLINWVETESYKFENQITYDYANTSTDLDDSLYNHIKN